MIEGPRAAQIEELPDVIRLSNSLFYPDGRIAMERVLPAFFCGDNLRVGVHAAEPPRRRDGGSADG